MARVLTVGSLFTGIGGFDLGLERAGFHVRWQVEVNEYCNRVLAKHWPHVRRYGDITRVDWSCVEPVDLVCGGFPCQPFSLAGKRRGTADDRYLWPEVVRCLSTVRPTWFFGENVPGIINLALDQVYIDLENIDYTVTAFSIPACAVDAPHIRQRIWIVAYSERAQRWPQHRARNGHGPNGDAQRKEGANRIGGGGKDVADADAERWPRRTGMQWSGGWGESTHQSWWQSEPELGRVAHGISHRVDRLRGLGNAIVPQIAEAFGHMIMEVTHGDRTDGVDERG